MRRSCRAGRSSFARRAAGVERRVAGRAIVERRVAGREERVRVVARRQVEVAGVVELDLAADVAADAAVHRDAQDLLLAREVEPVVVELEARQQRVGGRRAGGEEGEPRAILRGIDVERRVTLVDAGPDHVDGRVQARRVVQVDPAVGLEVRVDRDALQAFLVVLVQAARVLLRVGHIYDQRVEPGARIVNPHLARAGGMQHASVRQHREAHRLARTVIELHLLELRLIREHLCRGRGRQREQRQAGAQSCPSHSIDLPLGSRFRTGSTTARAVASRPEARVELRNMTPPGDREPPSLLPTDRDRIADAIVDRISARAKRHELARTLLRQSPLGAHC